MKIGAIRLGRADGAESVSARVEWEDSDRPPFDLRFSFRSGDAPAVEPNAFLIGAFLPALRAGERRVAIDGAICPRLRDGLRGAASVLREWYGGGDRAAPQLEPSAGFRAGVPPSSAGEAIFLSGGLDSLHLLLTRGSNLPREHPAGVRRAIFVENVGLVPSEEQLAAISARGERSARDMAAEARLALTVVSTNLLALHDDFQWFSLVSHGSFFGALTALFSGRCSAVSLAASDDARSGLGPWGSHPLLDPLFGTSSVRLIHEGFGMSREEKAAFVGRSPLCRRHLFVCGEPSPEDPLPNCGRCEKCLRTMMGLLVAGALGESETFPRDVDPERLRRLPGAPAFRRLRYYWSPLSAAARRTGRPDLADAIDARIEAERRSLTWHDEGGLGGALRRLDRRWLGGRALALRRRIARRTP